MTAPTVLDELGLLVVLDNQTDILSSVPAAVPRSSEVVHLLRDTPEEIAGRHVVFDKLCYACHGLSVLLTGRSGSRRHKVLFDTALWSKCQWDRNTNSMSASTTPSLATLSSQRFPSGPGHDVTASQPRRRYGPIKWTTNP